MPRDIRLYLEEVIEAISKIERFTEDMDFNDFKNDEKTRDAVITNLLIIGEAIRNVPEDIRTKYPDIEWRKIVGLRDVLIHSYFGIDIEIIWDIITNKAPELKKNIRTILNSSI